MSSISRRKFIKLILATTGGVLGCNSPGGLPSSMTISPVPLSSMANPASWSIPLSLARKEYCGNNLSGWEVVLGDAVYAAPGEQAVSSADIETVHFTDYSELRANILIRRIMAHNITFKRIIDNDAFKYIHTARYKFQLPYQPSTSNANMNGETVEGHLSIWDGTFTDLEYLVAFQWVINPWSSNYGAIQAWNNPGVWTPVGQITPDTAWHEVEMVLDTAKESTSLKIDGVQYPSYFVTLSHPDWGDEIAARFAAEIVSLYPGEAGDGALHETYFKDWCWIWEPRNVYLPIILKGN
jgi:hypothetical protein